MSVRYLPQIPAHVCSWDWALGFRSGMKERPKIMFRTFTAFIALSLPLPALAHPGHVEQVSGHSHWGVLAVLGVAGGLGLWAVVRTKRKAA